MIAPPFVSVPPPRYGGTELIVADLVTGLARAGHDVTLFASGDSEPVGPVKVRARFAEPVWPPQPYAELDHVSFAVEQILADARPFDIVHSHVPATFVAVSDRQRQLMPELADARLIRHGVDPGRYRFCPTPAGYCAFLGRFA